MSPHVQKLLQAARLNLAQGQHEEAEGQTSEAIRLDSKEPGAYLLRAECHRRLKRPERALADLAVAIRLDPSQPGPYVIRAEILKRRNQFDQAIADATHALTIDPRNAAAFSIRAECRSAIGDLEAANEDVQEMLLIDPTRPVPNFQTKSSEGHERLWKQSETKRSDDNGVFSDGKPVDKTYRSRQIVSDEDAAEALGVASGYKPGTIAASVRRHRTGGKNPQATPMLVGIVCLLLLGGVCLLMIGGRTPDPRRSQDQPATASKSEPEAQPVNTATEERAEAAPKTSVDQMALAPASPTESDATKPATAPSIEGTQKLGGHTAVVLGLAFSPDGKWLVSASGDSTVRLWNVAGDPIDNSHIMLGTNSSLPPKQFINVAFSPDGKYLAASNMDGGIFLWNAEVTPPKVLRTLKRHNDPVVVIAFSPDGKSLATGSRNDGLVCIWDLTDPSFPVKTSILPEKNGVWSLAYSPDGKSLFEGVSFPKPGRNNPGQLATPGQIWVWDVSQEQPVKKSIVRNASGGFPRTIVFSPDGQHIAYGDANIVRVRDVKSNKEQCIFRNHTKVVTSVAYTPDGKYLLSAAYDKTARLWDAKTGKEVLLYDGATEAIEPVAVSPDGRLIALAGHDKLVRLVRVRLKSDPQPDQESGTRSEQTGLPGKNGETYRFIDIAIDRGGAGTLALGSDGAGRNDGGKPEEAGTLISGIDGFKNTEITRHKDGRLKIIHDFQKVHEIDDLRSAFTEIDPSQLQIGGNEGVLIMKPIHQQGYRAAKLTYPRQLRLPLRIRFVIDSYADEGILGITLSWPKSLFNINLKGSSAENDAPREIECGWLFDQSKPKEWNSVDLTKMNGPFVCSSFQLPLSRPLAEERIAPRIGIRTSDQSSSTLKIRRIEVVAHVVGKIGVAFEERKTKVVVARLLEGAGARAGIKPGDEIASVEGQPVKGTAALMSRLAKLDAGDSVTMNVIRDGTPITVRVVAD